ncbi:formate/nitrite transporter family protein [Chitinivibrio alkaliphilus]|uniref:FNT family formate-nitrite transporter n=1 Tax=Chitinivibrio alkaliphilus ACht1 TaxID=1313304 RepID=U7D6G7_9BACT|nr:formate/nitrite transporter family protein [Chitinivibrio alkaliphilus]ERP31528.1 FNT family formate-nitrite transporter [Chitinivibrio alkaliphilus ACht1]
MYQETLHYFTQSGKTKAALLQESPLSYWIYAMLAGMYITMGIAVSFSATAMVPASSPLQSFLPLLIFPFALSFIVIAGAELFTSTILAVGITYLHKQISLPRSIYLCTVCYLANAAGVILTALLIQQAGLFLPGHESLSAIEQLASNKAHYTFLPLFFRGILCNICICLGVWAAARTNYETAKILLLYWAVFAFMVARFEHSIANMPIFLIPLINSDLLTTKQCMANLIPVTLGNILGGLCIAGAYSICLLPRTR